jgi:hypothetical protein
MWQTPAWSISHPLASGTPMTYANGHAATRRLI